MNLSSHLRSIRVLVSAVALLVGGGAALGATPSVGSHLRPTFAVDDGEHGWGRDAAVTRSPTGAPPR